MLSFKGVLESEQDSRRLSLLNHATPGGVEERPCKGDAQKIQHRYLCQRVQMMAETSIAKLLGTTK